MIGYYAHHHGVGHITRAGAIAQASGEPVTVLSSRPRPVGHAAAEWVELPLDTGGPEDGDHTANGALHWAPYDTDGLTDRMAVLADWVRRIRPTAMVVDVSVEVTLFLRLLGVRVIVMAIPGERDDAVHHSAYRVASAIIAPWSKNVYDPSWLHRYEATTTYSGSISRFDGRPRPTDRSDKAIVVLGAAGGTTMTAQLLASWTCAEDRFQVRALGVGGDGWVDDVWPVLCSAALVVTHAGQNAVADVAAAGVPSIVVAQDRPFGEQRATAQALGRAGIAVAPSSWPTANEFPSMVDEALALGGYRWSEVQVRGAAARAAETVASIAVESGVAKSGVSSS